MGGVLYVTLKDNKEMRLCQSDQSLCVVQMTGHNPNPTDTTSQPSSLKKKKSQKNARLEGCPEGQTSICNHSAFCKFFMREKIILHLCGKTFIQAAMVRCKIYQEIPSVPTDYTGLYSES